MPAFGRQTSCFMIEREGELILLDAGTGMANLGKYKSITDKYEKINIVFSHYHLDHLTGLSYIYNFFTDKELNLYFPQKSYSRSPGDILKGVFSKEISSLAISDFSKKVNIIGYNDDFYIGKNEVDIIEQKHSSPSFGVRIGNVTYLTDTLTMEEGFFFARESKILLHECWYISKSKGMLHSSLEEIAPLARKYEIAETLLVHLNPNIEREKYERAIAELPQSRYKIALADDLQEFEIK